MSFVGVAGLGLSAYGMYQGMQNAGDAQDAQNRALAAARTTLGGFSGGYNVSGLGPTATMDPQGAGFSLNYDADSQRMARGAGAYGSNMFDQLGTGINPMSLGLSGPMGLDSIMSRSTSAGNMSYEDMLRQMTTGFQRPLQNSAFMGAADQLRDASMGGQAAQDRTLALLRAQAAPFEQRGMDQLQNSLFMNGQGGSTGGGFQTEAFARGLGQADTDRQLAAMQEGRNFQNNAMGLATGMTGMGTGLRGTEAGLLQDAFGRFAQMQGMNTDLNEARFSRSMFTPMQLDQMRMGNISGALGIRSGLQDQALQMFQAGLAGSQAGANARIGAGSNMASIVGSPNFGMGGAMQANMWGQLGGALMGNTSASDILGRVFAPRGSSLSTGEMSGFAGTGINPYTAQRMVG